MSISRESEVVEFTAGQITTEAVTFEQPDGTAINLTGATVHLVVKRSMDDPDASALIDVEQDTHSDAAAGETELEVDLSALEEKYAVNGLKAVGIIWLVDASAQRIPYGPFEVKINPNPKRSFA